MNLSNARVKKPTSSQPRKLLAANYYKFKHKLIKGTVIDTSIKSYNNLIRL